MTLSRLNEYALDVREGRNMSVAIERILAPATRHPSRPPVEEVGQRLNIAVVFTSVDSTLAALKEAGNLANSLGARITLVVPQMVPYPLPLESPPIRVEFNENRFRVMASKSPVETSVHIYLCRDRFDTLKSVLQAGSIVVLGGRKRWWPTKDETLARQLRRAGYEVLYKETE
jgi:hypothetical protein